MSAYSAEYMSRNFLIGMQDTLGDSWNASMIRRALEADPTLESPLYPEFVPTEDVYRRLWNWSAESVALEYELNGKRYVDPSRQAIVKSTDGTLFGVFKDSYTIHQYDETLSFLKDVVSSELQIMSALNFNNGASTSVQIGTAELLTIEGDQFRPYIMITTSHDGTLATTIKCCVTRIVCDNTFAMAMGENGATWKNKHSRDSAKKFVVSDVKSTLGILDAETAFDALTESFDSFSAEMTELMHVEVSPKQFAAWMDLTAPIETGSKRGDTVSAAKRDKLIEIWSGDNRVAPWSGTAYGVLQLANTFNQHETNLNAKTLRGERNYSLAASGQLWKADSAAMDALSKVLVSV